LLIFIKMSFSKEKSQCSCTHKISHHFKVCLRYKSLDFAFWMFNVPTTIKYYNDRNERINVITVNIKEQPLCIISVYMPSENSNRDENLYHIFSSLVFSW
jgi:hypothetical protein